MAGKEENAFINLHKRGYTSTMDNGYEMETSDGEMDSSNVFVALKEAENI